MLVPRLIYGALDLTDEPFALEFGASYGAPESEYVDLPSLLFDGSTLNYTRAGNREITLRILVSGSDMVELADAESRLAAEVAKPRNILTLDPGDGLASPTAFDTFRASLTQDRSDQDELNLVRTYLLTIPALPFGRSENLTRIEVTPSPDAGTQIASCDATTGWATSSPGPGIAIGATPEYVVSTDYRAEGTGSVRSAAQVLFTDPGGANWTGTNYDRLSGLSIATGSGGFVTILVRGEWPTFRVNRMKYTTTGGVIRTIGFAIATGSPYALGFTAGSEDGVGPSGGRFIKYVMPVEDGVTISSIEVEAYQQIPRASFTGGSYPQPHVWYDDVRFAATASGSYWTESTVSVPGSSRTPCSLEVGAAAALGELMVMTVDADLVPEGFSPRLRPFLGAGSTSADADSIYGTVVQLEQNTTLTTTCYYDVPLSNMPRGTFAVWVRLRAGSGIEGDPVTYGARAQLRIGGADVGAPVIIERNETGSESPLEWLPIGRMQIPRAVFNATDEAVVRIWLSGGGPGFMDEALIVPTEAAFTFVDCGSGSLSPAGASAYFWADSPSPAQPGGGWWRGVDADRLDAVSALPDMTALGRHYLATPRTRVFALTTEVEGAAVAFEFYKTWHSNASED